MPISASQSILTNTGASVYVESLVWLSGSSSGAAGPVKKQRPQWDLTAPGTMTWNATKWPGATIANGYKADLASAVDVLTETESWDLPFLCDDNGTLSGDFTVTDQDGVDTDTDTSLSQAVGALSNYTRLYIDAAASNTEGEVYQTTFGEGGNVRITAIATTTNPYGFTFTEQKGTANTDGLGAMVGLSQDGAGHMVATVDMGITAVYLESVVHYNATLGSGNRTAGFVLRYGGGTSWLYAGLHENADEVQIFNRATNSTIATASLTIDLTTDYTLKVTDDGTEVKIYVDDVLQLTHTPGVHTGNTPCGIGGINVGTGNFEWRDLSFGPLNDGSGLSGDAISDIDVYSTLANREIDGICVDVTSGTYTPTQSIPVAQGINSVFRWADGATKPNIECDSLPVGTAVFKVGQSSVTTRRGTLRGFNLLHSDAVRDEIDPSSGGDIDTTTDNITVSAALYAACATEDPILYTGDEGSIPAGLTADTVYYVIKGATNTIQLATSAANAGTGTQVDITGYSDGAKAHLVLKGGIDAFDWAGSAYIDMCVADVDIDASTAEYTYRFIEKTFASTDRVACIRCLESKPKCWRYAFGFFGGPTSSTIGCKCGSTSTERPCRMSCGTNTVTALYNEFVNLNYSGKNPFRLQACGKSSVYGNRFGGSRMSCGGDAGDALDTRISNNVCPGVDVYDSSDIAFVSSLVTDAVCKGIGSGLPTGGDFGGAVGFRRDSTADGGYFIANILCHAEGEALNESTSVFGDLNGTSAANMASNIDIRNVVFSLDGNSSGASVGFTITNQPASAIITDCWMPEDSETTGDGTKAGKINGANVSEADWSSNAATASTTFAATTVDSTYQVTGAGNATIPNGVFSDLYGIAWTPGNSEPAGTVDSTAAAPTVASRSPADDASGVADTLVPELVFSENMKVSDGAQVIELRQVSDDSVLDSITAADATIDIGARTDVQLTGLSLSGVTGAVYIYLPSMAFQAIATGINYGGDTTNSDWNFSVGNLSGVRSRSRDVTRTR